MVVDNIPMFSCMCGHSSPNTNTLLIAFFVYCTLTASPSSSLPSPTTVIAMVSHFLFRQCCRHGRHQFSKKDALTNRIHIVGQTHFVSNYPFAGPWRKRLRKPIAHLLRDNSFSFKFTWQSYPLYFLKVSLICNIYLYTVRITSRENMHGGLPSILQQEQGGTWLRQNNHFWWSRVVKKDLQCQAYCTQLGCSHLS